MDETKTHESLPRSLYRVVTALSRAMELRDSHTVRHQSAVSGLARLIGQEMGLSTLQINGIRLGAVVHDIGKVGVPLEIITKPTQLSPAERLLMREHPILGAQVLGNIGAPWPLTSMVLQHHERLDGSGYPHGLSGSDILIDAQIIAVADITGAMLTDRPYRKALSRDTVIALLLESRGSKLNSDAVDIMIRFLETQGRGVAAPPGAPLTDLAPLIAHLKRH